MLTQPEGRDGAAQRRQTPATPQGTATSNDNTSGSPGILHCQETLIFPQKSVWFGETGEHSAKDALTEIRINYSTVTPTT